MAEQWIPYRLNQAADNAFGSSLESLWADWLAEVEAEATELRSRIAPTSALPPPELLTDRGRRAFYPTPRPGESDLIYVRADGRSDTRVVLLGEAGERTIARWNSLERPSWLSDHELLLPQVEFVDAYRVYRDLYRVSLDGVVTRLTHGLRVVHSAPRPGGEEIVAVLSGAGGNRLVVLSIAGEIVRTLREIEPGVLWSYPAWSPYGERIAVIRRRPGGWTSLVVLDAEGTHVRDITEDRSLNTSPAWSPDGEVVLWSSDRSGVSNLYAARASEGMDGIAASIQ